MKKIILILISLLTLQAYTCTTFILHNTSHLIFGRNLDWVSDEGIVVINKKGVKKTAFVPNSPNPAVWISKYGSITFNQFGKELPYGGMNEKGLVVEIMRSEAEYPLKDHRFELNELQWVQYQLDNCKNIDEIIATNNSIRINGLREQLHFLVCDKTGNKAVIEFHDGKMDIIKNTELEIPVLTNSNYLESVELFKNKKSCRFTTVAQKLNSYESSNKKIDPIVYSLEILEDVALEGSWSIVYDIKRSEIHFKSSSHKILKTINMNAFNFDCSTASQVYNINKDCVENINNEFSLYSEKENSELVQKAITSNKIEWPKSILDQLLTYASTCFCVMR